jgi:hypothetical protein
MPIRRSERALLTSGQIQIYKSDAAGSDKIKSIEAWCE